MRSDVLLLALSSALAVSCAARRGSSGPSGPLEFRRVTDSGHRGAVKVSRVELKQDPSCRWLKERIVDAYVSQYWRAHVRTTPGPCPPTARGRDGSGGPAGRGGRAPSVHFTKTNNQVAGVDESDRMKTDGTHLYTLKKNQLVILRVRPAAQAGVVARFDLGKQWRPYRLLLHGHRLVVFSGRYRWSRITVLDITRPERPRRVKQLDLEGTLIQERMVGDEVVFATNGQLNPPLQRIREKLPREPLIHRSVLVPCCGGVTTPADLKRILRRRVREALAAMDLTKLLPRLRVTDGPTGTARETRLLTCGEIHVPPGNRPASPLLTVTRLKLQSGAVESVGLLDRGSTMYMTPQNLYLAALRSRRVGRSFCGGAARTFMMVASQLTTVLHKFRLRGPSGRLRYVASAATPGRLLNQFALDEHRGHLRVATSTADRRRMQRVSNLLVFRSSGDSLKLVGSVANLAPGERIFAVRFLGDRGYLVTFPSPVRRIRIDPFFTLDLSNPSAPRVTGELKIPGWSNYLHPMSQHRLLAVGQDADQRGRPQGLHLQVFDVGNAGRPKRTHHLRFTRHPVSSVSASQFDHHAFLFDPVTRLLALPVQTANPAWAGAVVLKADRDGEFRWLGTVDHGALVSKRRCPSARTRCAALAPVTRSFVIGTHLYTLSRHGLRAHRLSDLRPVRSVPIR
ncbi:MAG: beta-propeller domain-containing protein [bacterium]